MSRSEPCPYQSCKVSVTIASNFQTRERAKHANSSLDQVDTKMISEVFIDSVLNGVYQRRIVLPRSTYHL